MAVSGVTFDHKPSMLEYQQLYGSFTNEEISPVDVAFSVAIGQSMGNWADAPRSAANWRLSQLVAIDLEKHPDAALHVAMQHDFFRLYGWLAHTTISHTEAEPRSRLIFLIDRPVTNVETWHWGALAIAEMFGMACDKGCAARGRAFLGSPNGFIATHGKLLPYSTFFMLSRQRERLNQQAREAERQRWTPNDDQFQEVPALFTLAKWAESVRSAPEGQRNEKLNKCAFMAGRYLVAKGADPNVIEAALIEAGQGAGLPHGECVATVKRALRQGMSVR